MDANAVWNLIQVFLPGRAVTLVLWTGLAMLSVALVVLSRTRWGEARPMSKCVVLSLCAHVLFAAYAYGTRLFVDLPDAAALENSVVTMRITASDDDPSQASQHDPMRPWELPPDSVAATAAPPVLERVETEPQLAQQSPPDFNDPTLNSAQEPELVSMRAADHSPEDPAEPAPSDSSRGDEVAAATKLDVPQPEEALSPAASTAEPAAEIGSSLTRMAVENLLRPPAELFPNDLVLSEAASQASRQPLVAKPSVPETDQGNHGDAARRLAPIGDEDSLVHPGDSAVLVNAKAQRVPLAAAAPPVRPGDGGEVPRIYQARVAPDRHARAAAAGGDQRTEAAVQAALAWLAANQNEDGRWSAAQFGAGQERNVLGHNRGGTGADADTGVTGLALLAFLGAGQTHYEGQYREQIQRGLEFLLRTQAANGSLAGDARVFASMYCHGIAFLAISEAYAMTGDARLKPFVQRAQQYTLLAQIPHDGGWRYQPGDIQGDMSQFGWQVMALRSAELAGIPIPDGSRQGMKRFLQGVSSGTHGGIASYRAGHRPSRAMTAEASTCRYFLEVDPHFAREQEASDFLAQELPGQGTVNLYYWYYGTLALRQMNDQHWDPWNEALKRELLRLQVKDGPLTGSWNTDTQWGGYGGRVYTTAMAALCLEVYYRYLPVYGAEIVARPGTTRR